MVLRHGKKIEEGETGQILQRPQMEYTKALVMTREAKHDSSRHRTRRAETLLNVSNVTASYAKLARVLQELSFSVCRGETVAIVGESGSGKSTLARVITGLLPRESGEIV